MEYTATISSLSVHPIQYLLTSDKSQLYHYTHGPGFDGYPSLFDESMQTFKEAA